MLFDQALEARLRRQPGGGAGAQGAQGAPGSAGATGAGPTGATGATGAAPALISLPQGTFARRYTFDTTIQSWTTDGGTLSWQSTAGGRAQIIPASGANQTCLEPSSAAVVADGEFYVDLTATVLGDDTLGEMGVVFRATDASNHYCFFINTGAPTGGTGTTKMFRLFKKVSGSYTQLNPGTVTSALGDTPLLVMGLTTARVLVRFVGPLIQLFYNETFIGAWHDTTYTTGIVGVRVGSNVTSGTFQFDNATVYTLASSWTPANY